MMIMLRSSILFFYACITSTVQDSYIQNLQKWNTNDQEQNFCRRICEVDAPPKVCQYTFEIDWYHTMTDACRNCPYNVTDCFQPGCIPGDGTKRGVVAVNRKLPGPSIEVCQNDIIIVDITNKMDSEATTLHWHGQNQKSCPYMDGVPYITQCPIQPYSSFRYTFKASQAGTHFWHSHMGMQRVDGAFGPLIVRVPKEKDYHHERYDFDLPSHVMVINDWGIDFGSKIFLSHFYTGSAAAPTSLLINGLGRYKEFDAISVPTARFKVDRGYRYRFRVINSGSLNCPIEMTVNNHSIEIISSDGVDIKLIRATSLITYAGERFDFIINANQTDDLYWIKFKGLINCGENYDSVFQVAVLEYNGLDIPPYSYPVEVVSYFNAHNDGIQVNPLNQGMESDYTVVPAPRMKSVKKWDVSLKPKPDFKYYVGFDFNNISSGVIKEGYEVLNKISGLNAASGSNMVFGTRTLPDIRSNSYTRKRPVEESKTEEIKTSPKILIPQFNHISMLIPPIALLPQREQLPNKIFCNNETMQGQNCKKMHCQCLHGIKIPLGTVAEFVFVDEGCSYQGSHPIHLHGYHFRVVAMERIGSMVTVEEVIKRDAMGLIHRNLIDAPFKDTVTVPDGGYTVIRFVANNPGYWILHCHVEVHMALGMAMILQVGEKEEMVSVPEKFPKCGHYVPDIYSTVNGVQTSSIGIKQINFLVHAIFPIASIIYRIFKI